MTRETRQSAADELRYQLTRNRDLRLQLQSEEGLGDRKRILSEWQAERLAETHHDLLQSSRHHLAAEFFLTDLYGPKDFSRRDSDLERSYPIIIRTLPEAAIHTVAQAVELDVLSHLLDLALVEKLISDFNVQTKEDITKEVYAEAYRRCNNREQRAHQIKLIRIIGEDLDAVVAKPFIYTALRMARGPAHLAGFGELQDFLERGFCAFRHMRGAMEFLDSITSKESQILDRIYNNHPQPFNLEIPD